MQLYKIKSKKAAKPPMSAYLNIIHRLFGTNIIVLLMGAALLSRPVLSCDATAKRMKLGSTST